MAGKKKKKPAANPARGFATVSIPSKPKESAVDPDTLSGAENDLPIEIKQTPSKSSPDEYAGSHEPDIAEMTPEQLEAHLEKEDVRLVVEKNSVTVKSHALRCASRLQTELRQMRAQADKAFVSEAVKDLLEDVLQMTSSAEPKKFGIAHSPCVDETEILLQLWTLQEVLTHLQMPSIHDALVHTLSQRFFPHKNTVDKVSGLAEAFDWYASHFTSDELPQYENHRKLNAAAEAASRDEESPSDESRDSKTNTPAIEYEPAEAAGPIDKLPHEFDLNQFDEMEDEDDPSLLIEWWMKLQTLDYQIEQHRTTKGYDSRKQSLREKLAIINRDPLFDRDIAEQQWRSVRRDIDIRIAQDKHKSNDHTKSPTPEHPAQFTADDADLDSMLGDMFENDQSTGAQVANALVTIKDFGGYSGTHPRRILEDVRAKHSALDGVKFTPLQVNSYSARLNLTLFWRKEAAVQKSVMVCVPPTVQFDVRNRAWSFTMKSLAAVNSSQAEAFLSTLALFVLDSEGYSNNKSYVLLPKTWKEMYMDFRDNLQKIIKEKDVENVAYLQRTMHEQIRTLLVGRDNVESQQRAVNVASRPSQPKLSATEAAELWQSRVGRPSFQKMQPVRTSLPVFAYRESILQTSDQSQIILVCADTGAGKSTQIPSYVLEHGLSQGKDIRILTTQPRRISAISIARRVSEEMGEDSEHLGTSRSLVGYAIRLESKVCASTRLTFATTGVLLRMLQDSFNLDQYDYLILDEVHERTMDLDLIFIALKRLQMRRTDLKIILMSATVETNKFSAYFSNCPVLQIPGRTFPVRVGFLEDAIEDTLGLLGKPEASQNVDDSSNGSDDDEERLTDEFALVAANYSSSTLKALKEYDHKRIDYQLILRLATVIASDTKYEQYNMAMLIFMPGLAEIRRLNNILITAKTFSTNWVIHMLHSSFSTRELEQAFVRPPPGVRKIVIATNIAETGITIPDVTAVIDTCKEKVMRFDERRQLSRLTEGVISQSSARQRRGRAARVQNGLCFHLIPKHQYDHKLPEQSTPEILRLSLQQSLLRIKVWNLGSIEDVLSQAIDPPTAKNTHRAVSKLKDAGAIDSAERLTSLGKLLAKLPLDVALGKLAIYGVLFQNLDAVVTIIAIVSVKSIFTESRTARDYSQTSFFSHNSDLLTTYNIYCAWKKSCKIGIGQQFCRNQHLSYTQLLQVDEQKIQLLVYVSEAGLILLDQQEKSALNRSRASRRIAADFDVPARYNTLNDEDVTAAVIAVAFYPRILRRDPGPFYRNVYTNQHLQVASLPREKIPGFKAPKWLCYMETMQVKGGKINVLNSSRLTELLIITLLGDADFNFFAGVITIDNGNIRLSLQRWKEMLALKRLREQFRKVVNGFLADPSVVVNSDHTKWVDLMVKILLRENHNQT